MFKCILFQKYEWKHAIYRKISMYQTDDPYAVLTQLHLVRVIGRHMTSSSFFFYSNFWLIEHWRWF